MLNFFATSQHICIFENIFILSTLRGSPIRSLIESGFNANERSDVRLYYGARNLQRMAYQVSDMIYDVQHYGYHLS